MRVSPWATGLLVFELILYPLYPGVAFGGSVELSDRLELPMATAAPRLPATMAVQCTYGPPLPLHSISSCNGECQTFYTLEQAQRSCSSDRKCKGICAEQRHSNISCSYATYSPRTGKLQATPPTGPFHNQTAWLINNSDACGHGPPPAPPPDPKPTPPGPPPAPPAMKQMPYPIPRSVNASGPPVQLAQAVAVVLLQPDTAAPPVPCGDGTICRSILTRYERLLAAKTSGNFVGGDGEGRDVIRNVSVQVTARSSTVAAASVPLPDTPEEYTLTVNGTAVLIQASSIFGARAGLESFSQMVANRPGLSASALAEGGMASPGGYLEHSRIVINDQPVHAYRGLMIDTGRNFLSTTVIKRLIVGMAMLKINVLHWHLTDDQSFPISTSAFPELAQKTTFSPAAHYSSSDLREIVWFAAERGVRVMPEIETPGHGACRAKVVPQLNLSTCPDVLNPTLNGTYDFLLTLLSEISPIFPEPTIFLGGDEVKFKCFDEDPAVSTWMSENCASLGCCDNMSQCSLMMLSYFFEQMQSRVIEKLPVKRAMGVWLADSGNAARGWNPPNVSVLPSNTLYNVYQSMDTAKISLSQNRSTVVSVAGSQWYLDYKPSFEAVWNVRPCVLLGCDSHPGFRDNLLGGEVCMWGSKVDGRSASVDTDAFAGGLAAVAERLWSDPPVAIGTDLKGGAAMAKKRYHQLACHWSLWGIPTYDRLTCGGEIETKEWPCSYAGGSLSVTPIFGDGDCPSDWIETIV